MFFLKGLYFEKIRDKNGFYGFSLYHEKETFRKRMIFHRSQDVIDEWIGRLRIYCQFFDLKQTYQMNHKLGGGKFSDVIQAMNLNNKKTYALKKIDKEKLTPKEKLFLRDEIQIVSQLSHPNVVEVREYYQNPKYMWIVMEHVHGGELNSYLRKNKVSEANMVNIMRQLIEGLRYLHMCGIVHRDLKPENILIEVRTKDDFVIKITDFGLSKLANRADLLFECCGTPAYVAPEVLIKKGYQSEVDLWSCGVILYAMVCKKFPFHSNDRKETFNQIKHKDPEFHHKQF